MSSIKGIVLGLCAASLVLGATYMLRPTRAATEKSIRFAFAVIFLSIMVVSVSTLVKKDFSFNSMQSESMHLDSAEGIIQVQAEYLSSEVLRQQGIDFKKISVLTDKSESGDIFIKRITVVSGEDPQSIRKHITRVIETNGVEVRNE